MQNNTQYKLFRMGGIAQSETISNEASVVISEELAENKTQIPYYPTNDDCKTLGTVVPVSMASEQKNFNQRLTLKLEDVNEYVREKLKYRTKEDLCLAFKQEQIDAIATAIWNNETSGDSIIIADQTGVGKGRTGAGLIRYSIKTLGKVPIFITEKANLINDIYRDLYDIGFDAGVPKYTLVKEEKKKAKWSDAELLKIIKQDIEDDGAFREGINYELPSGFRIEFIVKKKDAQNPYSDEEKDIIKELYDDVVDDLIELYRELISETGLVTYKPIPLPIDTYNEKVDKALLEGRELIKPFILNSSLLGVTNGEGLIIYENNEQEKSKILKKRLKGNSYIDDADVSPNDIELPKDYKLICLSYSQLGTPFFQDNVLKNKIKLLQKYFNNSVIVLDEAHNAAGTTSTGAQSNTGKILQRLMPNAKMITFLSGTHAKRPENMPIYARYTCIKESSINDLDMISVFKHGGNALQEGVSAELVLNGQLLRRERIIEGASEFKDVDENTDLGRTQIARLQVVSQLYNEVKGFNDLVAKKVKDSFNTNNLDKEENKYSGKVNRFSFQLFNFMLLGIKVNQTVEEALKALNNGEKTIIAVANTLESALDNFTKTFMTSNSDLDKYKIGDEIQNDFNLYLAWLLNYTMRYKTLKRVISDTGRAEESWETIYMLDAEDIVSNDVKNAILPDYIFLLNKILNTPTNIPLAPIDVIMQKIEDGGFSIKEITGRGRKIVFSNDDFSKGTIAIRQKEKTSEVTSSFNKNITDALIINQSGATGISMHAIPTMKGSEIVLPVNVVTKTPPTSLKTNKNEVKARHMIITQIELDIAKEVQKLGRINRTGQVFMPKFTYLKSVIPAEARLSSLMEKKLRSLMSLTAASQEQGKYLFEADDFFSDIAIEPFNETMDLLNKKSDKVTTKGQIENYFKTLYFRSYDEQKEIIDTFTEKLNDCVRQLKELGLYTGKMEIKDYKSSSLAKYPFYIGNINARTSFGGHSYVEKSNVTLFGKKNLEQDVTTQIIANLSISYFDDNNGNDVMQVFNTIEDYQKALKKLLDANKEIKQSYQNVRIEEINKMIRERQVLIDAEQVKLNEFQSLEEALAIKEQLDEVVKEIKANGELSQQYLADGEFDKNAEVTNKIQELYSSKKALESKLEPVKSVLERQSEYKGILRVIKDYEGDIEKMQKSISNRQEDISEYNYCCDKAISMAAYIGRIMDYKYFEENRNYDEQINLVSFSYNEVANEKVVLTGIKLPKHLQQLTLGQIRAEIIKAQSNESISFYSMFKTISEEDLAKHRKNEEELSPTKENLFYKTNKDLSSGKNIGGWNSIVSNIDTSYSEMKYFVNGSLLRTFHLSRLAGYNGHILKYTTSEDKTRLGIEIPNKNINEGVTTVYDQLNELYSEETSVSYVICFDGNEFNVDKLVKEYIYNRTLGDLYDAITENKLSDFVMPELFKSYYFEIAASQGKKTFLEIKVSESAINEARSLYSVVQSGENIILGDIIEFQEFIDNHTNYEIYTDDIRYTDLFAKVLEMGNYGFKASLSNYNFTGHSSLFPDLNLGKEKKAYLMGKNVSNSFLKQNVFKISSLDRERLSEIGFTANLWLSSEDFTMLIRLLEKRYITPMFATASKVFERYKNFYNFNDMFADTVVAEQNIEGDSEGITLQPLVQGVLQEDLDKLIEDILNKL